MQLAELLAQLRALYVEEFGRRIAQYPQDVQRELKAEALYLNASNEVLRTGELQLPARGDVCARQSGRIVQIAPIESARSLEFEPFRFLWRDGLQVALHPFAWDCCSVCVPEPLVAVEFEPVRRWFNCWVLPDQVSAIKGEALGALHSLQVPRQVAEGTRFEIDFGTAPVAAFEALLDACAEARHGLLIIGVPAQPAALGQADR